MPSCRDPRVLRYIAANVRRIRRSQRISQIALAELVAVHPTYIQKIERGLTDPSATIVHALAVALKVGVADLFREAAFEPPRRGRPRNHDGG